MPPKFTPEEQLLISTTKVEQPWGSSYMWTYLFGGLVIAGFAAYYQNNLMLLSAFLVLCGFRIHEERQQVYWNPIMKSIIEKFESAVREAEQTSSAK